jgi:Asp-tRNA(Asn)/Glu-tRNA(Gln) amidotransferase A subunit family amidase
MTELWRHSASEFARRIAPREVSAVEVVEAHLNRIDAINSTTRSIQAKPSSLLAVRVQACTEE